MSTWRFFQTLWGSALSECCLTGSFESDENIKWIVKTGQRNQEKDSPLTELQFEWVSPVWWEWFPSGCWSLYSYLFQKSKRGRNEPEGQKQFSRSNGTPNNFVSCVRLPNSLGIDPESWFPSKDLQMQAREGGLIGGKSTNPKTKGRAYNNVRAISLPSSVGSVPLKLFPSSDLIEEKKRLKAGGDRRQKRWGEGVQ